MPAPKTIAEHLDAELTADSGFHTPFRVHVFRPFDDDIYAEILARLPPDECYRQLPHRDALRDDGTSTRLVLHLKQERIQELPDSLIRYWTILSGQLKSHTVTQVFRKHMQPQLQRRFGDWAQAPLHPSLLLFRDFSGYRIKPHPDSKEKVITVHMYLPDDDSQKDLGTTFYDRDQAGEFQPAWTVDYLPNTAYAFTVSRRSWHGTEFRHASAKPRNSMMLIYYAQPYDGY